jgi:hypothetical protein
MQLETGFMFTDPKTDYTWEIAHPWLSRWRKQQVGWICKRAGFNPLQYPVSNWYEHDIITCVKARGVNTNPVSEYSLTDAKG